MIGLPYSSPKPLLILEFHSLSMQYGFPLRTGFRCELAAPWALRKIKIFLFKTFSFYLKPNIPNTGFVYVSDCVSKWVCAHLYKHVWVYVCVYVLVYICGFVCVLMTISVCTHTRIYSCALSIITGLATVKWQTVLYSHFLNLHNKLFHLTMCW